jgi:signal transduction histidine kinase
MAPRFVGSVRRALTTVRGRSAWSSALVVAVALVVGAAVMLTLFANRLVDNLDRTLQQQVQDRVDLLERGIAPDALTNVLQEEAFVWIGRPDGTVLAQSGAVVPLESPILANIDSVSEARLLVEERKPNEVEVEEMEFRLASASTTDGSVVVVAGAETESIGSTIGQLAVLFAIAIPLIVLLVGLLAWRTAARALRPVDEIRAQALMVTGASLSERVPVPGGTDEIHELAITMNDMLHRLESHERSLRQFTADASHELKSPVANLRAIVDTTNLSDPAWPDLKVTMTGETDRLRDLVDNLLFLARRGELDGQRGELVLVHLDDILFDEAETLAAAQRVAIDISGVNPVAVIGEREPLRRMIRNLADNAAGHATAKVWLACSEGDDGAALLQIADDGAGIPHHERERIFERFTRLDEARDRDGGGAGLGLAIVQQIVVDHGGTVAVQGSIHGGAELNVRLPSRP